MNPNDLLRQMMKVQQNAAKAQSELEAMVVEGTAGGGAVKIVMGCNHEVKEVKLDPEILKPEDKEMVEDMVRAAMADALEKAQQQIAAKMQGAMGGMKIPGMM